MLFGGTTYGGAPYASVSPVVLAPVPVEPPSYYGGQRAYYDELELRQRILRDDNEILELLGIIVPYL